MHHAGDSPTLFLSLEVGWKPGSKSNMVHPKHFGTNGQRSSQIRKAFCKVQNLKQNKGLIDLQAIRAIPPLPLGWVTTGGQALPVDGCVPSRPPAGYFYYLGVSSALCWESNHQASPACTSCGWAPTTLYLRALTLRFHDFYVPRNITLRLIFFSHWKMEQPFLPHVTPRTGGRAAGWPQP